MRIQKALANRLVAVAAAAAPGHCVRIDDVAEVDAIKLAEAVAEMVDAERVAVAVLDTKTEGYYVDVERAVAIRNDKSHVFLLLVPPGQAHAASSLDNSFERLPLVVELEAVIAELRSQISHRWPSLPVQSALRASRAPLEARLDFLAAVLDGDDEAVFGAELWRAGLLVDDETGAALRSNVEWNARLVTAVVAPSTVTTTVRERLRKAGVAPGEVFEKLVAVLTAAPDLHDSVAWAHKLYTDHHIKLPDVPRINEVESALEALEMQPFRKADGSIETYSKLKSTDDGALFAETSPDNPGAVGLRWKAKPPKPSDVENWLLELLPPADLRTDDTTPALDMKVKGTRSSAQLKLELGADDLTGGSLFVVRITALDSNAIPMLLTDGSPAVSETDQFEVVIQEAPAERSTRKSSANSLADAQLRAILAGARDTDLDMQAWDLDGGVFSVRVGRHLASQIRVAPVLVGLQRRVLEDPSLTTFRATSPFGDPIGATSATGTSFELPATLRKRRQELLTMLQASAPHDLPEVFRWDEGARQLASDYALTYKRALESAATEEARTRLLRLDTLEIEVGTATGREHAVVVLPLHPLRAGWIAAHYGIVDIWCAELLELGSAAARKLVVDDRLAARVQPINLPFSALGPQGTAFVYYDELTFGSGLLLDPAARNPEAIAASVYGALGLQRDSTAVVSAAAMVSKRLDDFRRTHPAADALRLAALNPGDGEILGRAVESVVSTNASDGDIASVAPPRVEVVGFGCDAGFASPLPRLAALQDELQIAQVPGRQNHLAPPLGLALRPPAALMEETRSYHMALIQDVAVQRIDRAREEATARQTAFHDLLTPAITVRTASEGKPAWVTSAALTSTAQGAARAVVDAHRAHQFALGAALDLSEPPALVTDVEPDGLEGIRVLHELADWVLTLDRFVGLDLYEDPLAIGLGSSSFILDYAPDFIEGLSHRLTVTTRHRGEVARILERAMDELGLDAVTQSVTPVIDNLLKVSGRLVLRLQGSDGFAREAVSLAALMAHLHRRGKLEGTIIVPVDSHEEIFGRAAREPDLAARRCDLLLVSVTRSGIKISCIEVKSRKAAALPAQLADDIVDQLEETKRLLISRFFATDPARIDAQLQRARLAGILHYYADRAVMNGTMDGNKITETHRLIDRHLESDTPVEISMHGYVISLQGSAGFPSKHRQVPLTVLTAADLGQAGFTTKFDEPRTPTQPIDAPIPSTPGPATPSQVSAAENTADVAHEPGSPELTPQPSEVAPTPATGPSAPLEPAEEASSVGNATDGVRRVDVMLGHDPQGAELIWSVSTEGSPHSFVIGIPGQGKSVTTRRIVREFADAGLPSLLFDFHGDMAASPPAGASILDASNGLPFSPFEDVDATGNALNMVAFETAEIVAYVAGLGEIQRSHVYKALQSAYTDVIDRSGPGSPTVAAFADALEQVEADAKGKHARERVRPLTDFGLFTDKPDGAFDPRAGGAVVDVSRIPLEQVQLAAGAFLLRKIYRDMFTWPQDGTLKLAIVLDEAHRMAKDVTLPKLMKEGRKYGVCVVVASQGTADFHKDVLGNAGTKIVFRTNFPASKQVAGYLRGRTGQDLSQEIEKLGVGQAYVSTPDSPQARKVTMAE